MDFGNTNQKIWQCFVCGVQFKEGWIAMKNHIFEEHEEGREYVKCPLARCNAPIRDVKSHFKAKHPRDKIPPCQMKALIWKDFSTRKKKKKSKKPNFDQGKFFSEKNGKAISHKSGYEKTVYECLEHINEVVGYQEEPFSVPYFYKGERREYYPDLIVHLADGKKEVWEIKPSNQTHIEQNRAKWDACYNYCLHRGWPFKVKTEKGIEQLKKGQM